MVVYKIVVAGKPYIGMTFDLKRRSREHLARIGNNPMYKVATDDELRNIEVIWEYKGESTNKKYLKSVLKKKEIELIKQHNSYLNGWNQQVANELPSQSLRKYILDSKLTKDPVLISQLEWKIQNTNLPMKEYLRLCSLLWGELNE